MHSFQFVFAGFPWRPLWFQAADSPVDAPLHFPAHSGVRAATLLLLKEKCGRYSLLRVSAKPRPFQIDLSGTLESNSGWLEIHHLLNDKLVAFTVNPLSPCSAQTLFIVMIVSVC